MGWIFSKERVANPAAFIRAELGPEVIASKMVGDVFYGACKNGAEVIGLVVLIERNPGEFGWKVMDESMGPNESRCPAEILALLSSPPPGPYAVAWRARCLANLGAAPIGRGQMDLLAASGVA